jgi:dUTP pyrophosphatase
MKRHREGYDVFPGQATIGSAGFDLVADIEAPLLLEPGQRIIVPTGIAIALPPSCVGLIFSRSGLASSSGLMLSNGVGVVDTDYRGEIGCALINLGDACVNITPGMRIAQLVVMNYSDELPVFVTELPESDRGEKGFGSTGK